MTRFTVSLFFVATLLLNNHSFADADRREVVEDISSVGMNAPSKRDCFVSLIKNILSKSNNYRNVEVTLSDIHWVIPYISIGYMGSTVYFSAKRGTEEFSGWVLGKATYVEPYFTPYHPLAGEGQWYCEIRQFVNPRTYSNFELRDTDGNLKLRGTAGYESGIY